MWPIDTCRSSTALDVRPVLAIQAIALDTPDPAGECGDWHQNRRGRQGPDTNGPGIGDAGQMHGDTDDHTGKGTEGRRCQQTHAERHCRRGHRAGPGRHQMPRTAFFQGVGHIVAPAPARGPIHRHGRSGNTTMWARPAGATDVEQTPPVSVRRATPMKRAIPIAPSSTRLMVRSTGVASIVFVPHERTPGRRRAVTTRRPGGRCSETSVGSPTWR